VRGEKVIRLRRKGHLLYSGVGNLVASPEEVDEQKTKRGGKKRETPTREIEAV